MRAKHLVYALTLAASSSAVLATDTCYTVEGKVETVNVSTTSQVGLIEISMFDRDDYEVFRQTGELVGTIVGGGYGYTELAHTAIFPDGSSFVTSGDKGYLLGVRKFDSSTGMPCAFDVDESVTKISAGTGIFESVTNTEIIAGGYVNTCLSEGENENEFDLSGVICTD